MGIREEQRRLLDLALARIEVLVEKLKAAGSPGLLVRDDYLGERSDLRFHRLVREYEEPAWPIGSLTWSYSDGFVDQYRGSEAVPTGVTPSGDVVPMDENQHHFLSTDVVEASAAFEQFASSLGLSADT